jgi:hypothetical protein
VGIILLLGFRNSFLIRLDTPVARKGSAGNFVYNHMPGRKH